MRSADPRRSRLGLAMVAGGILLLAGCALFNGQGDPPGGDLTRAALAEDATPSPPGPRRPRGN